MVVVDGNWLWSTERWLWSTGSNDIPNKSGDLRGNQSWPNGGRTVITRESVLLPKFEREKGRLEQTEQIDQVDSRPEVKKRKLVEEDDIILGLSPKIQKPGLDVTTSREEIVAITPTRKKDNRQEENFKLPTAPRRKISTPRRRLGIKSDGASPDLSSRNKKTRKRSQPVEDKNQQLITTLFKSKVTGIEQVDK